MSSASNVLRDVFGEEIQIPVDLKMVSDFYSVEISDDIPSFEKFDVVGSATRLESGEKKIWINPLENQFNPRYRFTLAHELGHAILHLDADDEFCDTRETLNRSSYWDHKEGEANRFAAELLMPERQIRTLGNKIIREFIRDNSVDKMPLKNFIIEMAELFEVSSVAMGWRLYNLGISKKKPKEVL